MAPSWFFYSSAEYKYTLMSPEQSVGQNHKGNMNFKSLENIVSLNIWERRHMKTSIHINLILYIICATILHVAITNSMHNIFIYLLLLPHVSASFLNHLQRDHSFLTCAAYM